MLCGLSGGADSVALVLVLKALGYRVVALHCNFQLRGAESERDEQFVREFCSAQNIELHTTRFDTLKEAKEHGESIEMAARRLRYDWFESSLSNVNGEAHICVAHHADDNVETMLLNLIRGAGLHGLTGMDFCNDRGVIRPLLGMTRAEIEEYLAAMGQHYIIDSTNTDTHYRRNKIRHELLPLLRTINPSIDRTLTETMTHLREAENALLNCDNTRNVYHQTQTLLQLGFSPTQIEQMRNAENGTYTTAGTMMLTKHRGELLWDTIPTPVAPTPVEARRLPREAVDDLRNPHVAVIDVRSVQGNLYIRSIREGDRFQPYGMKGTKLVSDYLTDRHRSRLEKLSALVLCDDAGILWLVGERIAARAAVTSTTTEVFVVSL